MKLHATTPNPSTARRTPAKAPALRFGLTENVARSAAELGMKNLPTSKFLRKYDFKEWGATFLPQIMIIYGSCILGRLGAAYQRMKESGRNSWNELREHATRDSLGYFSWLFATPVVAALLLRFGTPKNYRPMLVQPLPAGEGSGFRHLLNKINPLKLWFIPDDEQVKDQMKQAVRIAKETFPNQPELAKPIERHFGQAVKYRQLARGFGWVMTLAALGIGVNLYNMAITKRNVERQMEAQGQSQDPNPAAPAGGPSPQPQQPSAIAQKPAFASAFQAAAHPTQG